MTNRSEQYTALAVLVFFLMALVACPALPEDGARPAPEMLTKPQEPVSPKSMGIQPGFWAEWEVVNSPARDNRQESMKKNPLRLRILVTGVENDKLIARLTINGLDERQIQIESGPLDLTELSGDTALRGGFQRPERETGTLQTESGSIAVEKLVWRQPDAKNGAENVMEQWISPSVPLGPVYLKNDRIELKLVGFGQQQQSIPGAHTPSPEPAADAAATAAAEK